MRRSRGGATGPADGLTSGRTSLPPDRRRLPFLLLTLLSLVLGGALLTVALLPAPIGGKAASSASTAALAAAVTDGQAAIASSADQPPLSRVLGAGTPSAAALDKARGVLASLAATLGASSADVALVDAAGRARASGDRGKGAGPATLPPGTPALDRILALRSGALVAATGASGRTIVFAAPVEGPSGAPAGAVVASVPVASLVGSGTVPAGTVSLSSTGGATWAAITGDTTWPPVPRPILLGLAALSLLAIPLAWWARRAPRTRGSSLGSDSSLAAAAAAPFPARPTPSAFSMAAYQAAQARPVTQPTVPVAPPPPVSPPAVPPVPLRPAVATAMDAAPAPAKRRGRFSRGRREEPAAPLLVDATSASASATMATLPDELLDELSGLGNQRGFGEELERLFVAWQRNQVPFALLLVDVDGLKVTNSRSGHTAGDEQLRALGRQIKAMLRFSDRAFRTGGDEFAVLLPHTDAAGAVHMGQRLLGKTRSGDAGEPAIAFSAGAAALPGPAQDRDQLLAAVGAALTWGKRHGRASVVAYDPACHTAETDADRMEKEAAVAQVIRDRSLRAAFQPIVDMQTGDVVGFEGLTRPGPGAPFTNPGALFEAAELAGRTVELDAACFETIAEGARAIPADKVVSINLSPRTMEAADFSVAGVLATLRSYDLDPGRVILELTERETVLDLDRLRDNLSELQRAGVRIAADDVGAGNAGLRLLSQFRFDIVKVDLSLVQEGANNDASRAILRSLRDLAQRWGAFVIAEGIETPTQLKVVRELGLAAGQGFLIGRPGYIVDLPQVDLVGLEQGGMMMQMAPAPVGHAPQGSPA